MRTLLLGALISVAVVVGASAADLATPPAPVYTKAPMPAAAYNWTGFYIGGNAGYASGRSDPSTTTEFTPTNYWNSLSVPQVNAAGVGSVNHNGFVGGGQAGFNWQTGALVVGAEVEFDSFHLNASRTAGATYLCCAGSFQMTQSINTDWLFTARGRLGWAVNNWLFYGTGGLALTNFSHQSVFADTFGAAENVTDSSTKAGWVAGAGIEYGLSANWILRGEYLHLDFGSLSSISILGPVAVTGCNCTRMFHNANLTSDIGRFGIDYKL